jgi:hypothetical protein
MFNTMHVWLDENWTHLIDSSKEPPADWVHPSGLQRWASELGRWATAVRQAITEFLGHPPPDIIGNVCCFIDGTFQYMSQPGPSGNAYVFPFI